MVNAKYDLSRVKPCKINLQPTKPLDQPEKLASLDVLHKEVEGASILLDAFYSHNEGVVEMLLQGHLVEDMVNLLVPDQLML